MKKTTLSNCRVSRLLAAALLLLTVSVSANAYSFSAKNDDGKTIYYNILGSSTCEVTHENNNASISTDSYWGNVVIPKTVTRSNGTTYTVTSIGSDAFYACHSLTSITIPNSVTSIGDYAFIRCTQLTSITIPNSVTSISGSAFSGSGLKEFDVAEDNEYYCAKDGVLYSKDMTTLVEFPPVSPLLPSFDIPECVTEIGSYAFKDCTGLTEVTIPNSVTTIGYEAFIGCTGLTSVTIGNSVKEIEQWAFNGCTGLTEVNFNATACASAGSSSYPAFKGCTNISTFNFGDNVTIIPDYLCYDCSGLTQVTIPNSVTSIGRSAFYGCTGLTSVTIPNSVTWIGTSSFYKCSKLTEIAIPESVTSIGYDAFYGCGGLLSIGNTSKTQTTCTMKITSNISGAESGVVYNNTFYSVDDDGYCTFTDLVPGNSYSYYFGIKLDNGSSSTHGSISVTTLAINPQITQISLTPESFTAIGSYTEGDAVVTETGFTGYTSDGVTLSLTNLEPETEYMVSYYVTISGDYNYSTFETFTTPAVELTTLPAKATSNTVALLGATTNLSDDAVGAGFEWRRNDAPSTMPSNQAECPVIDGELTGTLNGLSATTYYDFRPYYTSQGGKTYYGDWVTFITADAYVYFEPTVRTYSATSVGSSSATVKAYAVAGSDNITSQGFEYWQGGSSSAMNVRRASTTDENGVTRVEVSGQWMTATLEDLEPSTTYSYRAYVTTAVGTTYGETMSFTTDVPTGIEAATFTEDAEVYEIARYTLDGKKVSQPQRGINIIRYSDGTAKKVLVK